MAKNGTLRCRQCGKWFKEYGEAEGLSAGKAAIGTLIAGPAGAVVGAAMGKKKKRTSCPYCGSYYIERL